MYVLHLGVILGDALDDGVRVLPHNEIMVIGMMQGGDGGFLTPKQIMNFVDGASVFITIGCTFAVLVASFPPAALKDIPKHCCSDVAGAALRRDVHALQHVNQTYQRAHHLEGYSQALQGADEYQEV